MNASGGSRPAPRGGSAGRIAFTVVDDRRAKLERLREQGIDPFPHEFEGVTPIADIHAPLAEQGRRPTPMPLASQADRRRGQRGAAFLDVQDSSGKLQIRARRDVLGEESFETLTSLDVGDLIDVDGTASKSRRGELSLRAAA